jgi:hypothetical protein
MAAAAVAGAAQGDVGINLAFSDEPTTNMDAERRQNLARQIGVKDFHQLFVISHDDTFEGYTGQTVSLDETPPCAARLSARKLLFENNRSPFSAGCGLRLARLEAELLPLSSTSFFTSSLVRFSRDQRLSNPSLCHFRVASIHLRPVSRQPRRVIGIHGTHDKLNITLRINIQHLPTISRH